MNTHRLNGLAAGAVLTAFLLLSGCSINQMAVRMAADALASGQGGGTAFTGDEDPQLVEDAIPFALKLYEILIQSDPHNDELLVAAGSGFISYAYAFIDVPASTLPYDEYEKQKRMQERAEKMYLRGRGYIFDALELRHPGFFRAVLSGDSGELADVLMKTDEKDVPALYWGASGWMAAVSASNMDFNMVIDIPRAVAMMTRALELEPDYDDGALHSLFIQVYGSISNYGMMYGSGGLGEYIRETLEGYYAGREGALETMEQRAEFHFQRAVELSDGTSASVYVSFAQTFPLKNQEPLRYRRLLERALAVDPDRRPETRMLTIISQEKARWLLEHMEEDFISLEPES
jgi:predicted anti-sigma-YlaC factor YlaD